MDRRVSKGPTQPKDVYERIDRLLREGAGASRERAQADAFDALRRLWRKPFRIRLARLGRLHELEDHLQDVVVNALIGWHQGVEWPARWFAAIKNNHLKGLGPVSEVELPSSLSSDPAEETASPRVSRSVAVAALALVARRRGGARRWLLLAWTLPLPGPPLLVGDKQIKEAARAQGERLSAFQERVDRYLAAAGTPDEKRLLRAVFGGDKAFWQLQARARSDFKHAVESVVRGHSPSEGDMEC